MLTPHDTPSLTVVIPALNEENAIAGTISRCLEARSAIKATAHLAEVEIIVVNDGSTDRTAEIARSFHEIKLITFAKNKGYGAAIKEGFRQGSGSLLGFLDADGTCDPQYFGDMCRVAIERNADVVLGSRLGPQTKMPFVRRLGNRFFAVLLGVLCGKQVTDTASGMRVIKRNSLGLLYPLPDRMHFTPAMSARAMLNDLSIVEIPMPYEERIGTSKLSVLKDGVCFLRAILSAALCYRPERLFMMGLALCLTIGTLLAAYPVEFYFRHHRWEDWMIYRFVVCFLLGACGLLFLSSTALSNQMAHFGPSRNRSPGYWPAAIRGLYEGKGLIATISAFMAGSAFILWPALVEYISSQQLTVHWSRLFAGAFGVLLATHTCITAMLLHLVELWKVEQSEIAGRGTNASEHLASVHKQDTSKRLAA